MSEEIVHEEERLSEKEMIEQIRELNPALWEEIAEIMDLLEEWGVRSYKLTGSIEDPVILGYRLT